MKRFREFYLVNKMFVWNISDENSKTYNMPLLAKLRSKLKFISLFVNIFEQLPVQLPDLTEANDAF